MAPQIPLKLPGKEICVRKKAKGVKRGYTHHFELKCKKSEKKFSIGIH
jgi:hypothetical protein